MDTIGRDKNGISAGESLGATLRLRTNRERVRKNDKKDLER